MESHGDSHAAPEHRTAAETYSDEMAAEAARYAEAATALDKDHQENVVAISNRYTAALAAKKETETT